MGAARAATTYIDYQQRASEFSVGDMAYPLAGGATDEAQAGRVVAVFPAIGQVDIEFPWGSGRYPVEDVQRVTGVSAKPPASENTTVPGGVGTVSVPGGPVAKAIFVNRVAHAYVKHALYWASRDRTYRGTKMECSGGKYTCPKCKADEDGNRPHLRPVNYKRSEGKSYRLLGCPQCLFLIKREHIIGDPSYEAPTEPEPDVEDMDVDILSEWDETMDQGFDSVRNVKAGD